MVLMPAPPATGDSDSTVTGSPSQTVGALPCSPGPCDQLTFGQEDLGCCIFSSLTIQKQKTDKNQ